MIPDDILFVSESGVKNADDIKKITGYKADAVLIGETMMRAGDKAGLLYSLREAAGQ